MYDDAQRLGDVERRYRTTLSRTPLRSDRGDLGMYTFAGSNLHGGRSPNAPLTGTGGSSSISASGRPSTDSDLYAPLKAAEYGRGYYDHLRATTPPRVTRSTPKVDFDDPSLYKSSFPETDLGDYNLKTTRHSEHWVPLTTHIYNAPYHTYYYRATPFSSYTYRSGGADDLYSYNYVDDYKRYSSTSKSSKVVDALDLSVTKSSYDSDISHYSSKCQQMQSQLDEVNKWVYEAEMKLKSDVGSSRSKIESELAEVSMIVDDTARYNEDLYQTIKKQAKQISKLNSQYDNMSRNLTDVSETLEKTRMRCQSLQSELSSVSSQLEMASKRVGTKTVRTTFLYG